MLKQFHLQRKIRVIGRSLDGRRRLAKKVLCGFPTSSY